MCTIYDKSTDDTLTYIDVLNVLHGNVGACNISNSHKLHIYQITSVKQNFLYNEIWITEQIFDRYNTIYRNFEYLTFVKILCDFITYYIHCIILCF